TGISRAHAAVRLTDRAVAGRAGGDLVGCEDRVRLVGAGSPVGLADEAARVVRAPEVPRAMQLPVNRAAHRMVPADVPLTARAALDLIEAHTLVGPAFTVDGAGAAEPARAQRRFIRCQGAVRLAHRHPASRAG